MKKAAKAKRELQHMLIKSVFEGADKMLPDDFCKMAYFFVEKKVYQGEELVSELENANDCILIKSGTCEIVKKKNMHHPFKVWLESLDQRVR